MPPYSYPSNLLPPETPSTVKRTQDPLFQTAPHPQRREAVCSDARPSTFEVSTEFFLDKVAPILRPDIDIPRVMENLKRDGTIVGNRFKKFSKDPSEMSGGEDTVFRKTFQVVVRKIIEAGKPRGIQSTLQFFHNGKAVPASDVRSNKTRPDSYGILRTAKGVRWICIGLTGEVKLGDTDGKRLDDNEKEMWNLHYILCEDAQRRFAFGFTVEDTQMKFWFCCRQYALVSVPFNFITECQLTVRFFLAIMYATPQQLGWDPTMIRQKNGQFDITVWSSTGQQSRYRTIKLLSNKDVDSTFGRGTRVWTVKELDSKGRQFGPELALKDNWIDSDRMREGFVYADLLKGYPDHASNPLCNFFLTVVTHGDVLIGGEQDNTETLILRASLPHDTPLFDFGQARKRTIDATGNYRASEVGGDAPVEPQLRSPRVHYRIVFKEVCKPLFELSSLGDVFTALSHACVAAEGMHQAGWLHRDLNPGNIFVAQSLKFVRVGDLEYAKGVSRTAVTHTVRTTTQDFKAVEAADMQYLFLTDDDRSNRVKPHTDLPRAMDIISRQNEVSESRRLVAPPQLPLPSSRDIPFHYNALHDLESLWWIAVYFIVNKQVIVDGEPQRPTKTHIDQAKKIFHGGEHRLRILSGPTEFNSIIQQLHPSVQEIARQLNNLRKDLVSAYFQAEQDLCAIDHTVGAALVRSFASDFVDISQRLRDSDITVRPLRYAITDQPKSEIATGFKRARGVSTREDMLTISEEEESSPASDRTSIQAARAIKKVKIMSRDPNPLPPCFD